jgi:hypothetical protein
MQEQGARPKQMRSFFQAGCIECFFTTLSLRRRLKLFIAPGDISWQDKRCWTCLWAASIASELNPVAD